MTKGFDVVFWAYSRPEFTKINLERLIAQPFVRKLYIAHDGVRAYADDFEIHSHKLVRDLLTKTEFPQKVELLIYDQNIGLTQHMFRVSRRILKNCNSFISHEDDKFSNDLTFRAFMDLDVLEDAPQQADTRNFLKHAWKDRMWRDGLYMLNGVAYLNHSLIDCAEFDFKSKTFSEKNIVKTLKDFYLPIFGHTNSLSRVVSRLSDMLNWSLYNQNRPDTLFLYSLLLRNRLKQVSSYDLCHDVSNLDFRGANQEYKNNRVVGICEEIAIRETALGNICVQCEREGIKERIPLGTLRRARANVDFNLDRLFGMRGGPRSQNKKKQAFRRNFSSENLTAELSLQFGSVSQQIEWGNRD